MGLLVDGQWQDTWYDTDSSGGRFERTEAVYRHWLTADGSAGPTGEPGFKAEAGRYHLYASYACPWAHRVLIYRALKGLESMISVSFVHWFMGDKGWTFEKDDDGIVGDALNGHDFLHQLYQQADSEFTGRVTVPVLWDKQRHTIVSNESSEIIRMLNTAFDQIGAAPGNYYPDTEQSAMDPVNQRIYETVNNGVYQSGFSTTQEAYDEAVIPLFETLDWLETILSEQRFLHGEQPLESDWRLLPTLLRFDLVYHGHFKCNRRRIVDYPNLSAYTRDLYQWPGIKGTCNFDHVARHYMMSHETINPNRIVSIGPVLDFDAAHHRDQVERHSIRT